MKKELNFYGAIKYWNEDDQPRERLATRGASALSNAELLAILINSGTPQLSALDLAKMVLTQAQNNLRELGGLSISDLKKTRGIGQARAITIAAALELGRRRQITDGLDRLVITSSKEAAKIIIPLLSDLPNEALCVLYLNNASLLIRHEIISHGGLTGTVVDIRVILKQALLLNANRIVIAHNHPSGNLQPSQSDRQITTRLKEAAALMEIELVDHIIVAGVKIFSMAEAGLLKQM
jgi:DNA repair protein RadC